MSGFVTIAKSPVFVVFTLLLSAGQSVLAQPAALEDRLLARGAVADTTPQQKYRTAINEAGGGYKVYLEECAALAAGERRSCQRQAKAIYAQDMAAAKLIIRKR